MDIRARPGQTFAQEPMTQLESSRPARHPLPLPEAATNSKGLPLEVGEVAGPGISEQGGEEPPLHFLQPRARFLRKKKV